MGQLTETLILAELTFADFVDGTVITVAGAAIGLLAKAIWDALRQSVPIWGQLLRHLPVALLLLALGAGLYAMPQWLGGDGGSSPRLAPVDLPTTSGKAGIPWVQIPAGRFYMGSNHSEYKNEQPVHTVDLREFWMSRTPVTNEQYGRFLAAHPEVLPPEYWGDVKFGSQWPHKPVVGISHGDALRFAKWVGADLPTEAQWEYACRAPLGMQVTDYCFGNSETQLGKYAWFYGRQTQNVAGKLPNRWGLYDMHGQVWEWCKDWYGPYPSDSVSNPEGPDESVHRVLRGGSWNNRAIDCRSAARKDIDSAALRDIDSASMPTDPSGRTTYIGFRLASAGRPTSE